MEKITVFSGMRGNNYMAAISNMSCDHVVNFRVMSWEIRFF